MKQPNTTLCNGAPQERLVTRDFCYVSAANFFLFLSFYALMPLLPFYLYERLGVGGAMVGGVLSSYMVACIGVRPVAGFLLDTFRRRPLYLLAYFLFAVLFGGYAVAASVAAFVLVRIGHGLAFGLGTVSGSTLVSQIVPRSRLGEGLGLYGLANTLAMCLGPMLGLAAYRRFSFDTLFIGIALAAGCGLLAAAQVRIPPRKQGAESAQGAAHRLTPDAFFVREGLWASLTQLLVYAPYGATTAYVAVYANELGLSAYGGLYFTLMAAGLAVSRPLAGKQADRGHIATLTAGGMALAATTYLLLSYVGAAPAAWQSTVFLTVAFAQGLTYGILHPSFNTLFVRLAPESRRGAATSMFLTSNDLGIGIGMLAGSIVAQRYGGFFAMYRLGALLALLAFLLFVLKTRPHFARHKVD